MLDKKSLKDLTEEQKKELLRDDNGNDVPDFLEEGKLPEEMGIDTGQPVNDTQKEIMRGQLRNFSRFVKVSSLKKLLDNKKSDESMGGVLEKGSQKTIKKWMPLILIVDLIIIGLVIYYFRR